MELLALYDSDDDPVCKPVEEVCKLDIKVMQYQVKREYQGEGGKRLGKVLDMPHIYV